MALPVQCKVNMQALAVGKSTSPSHQAAGPTPTKGVLPKTLQPLLQCGFGTWIQGRGEAPADWSLRAPGCSGPGQRWWSVSHPCIPVRSGGSQWNTGLLLLMQAGHSPGAAILGGVGRGRLAAPAPSSREGAPIPHPGEETPHVS